MKESITLMMLRVDFLMRNTNYLKIQWMAFFTSQNKFRSTSWSGLDLHNQKRFCHIFYIVGWVTLVRLVLPSATKRLTGCGGSSRARLSDVLP